MLPELWSELPWKLQSTPVSELPWALPSVLPLPPV